MKISKPIFASAKSYAYIDSNNNEIVKLKGVKKGLVSYDEFKKVFDEKIVLCSKFDIFRYNNFICQIKELKKYNNINIYNKRIFSDDRKTTTALYFHLLDQPLLLGDEYLINEIDLNRSLIK